MTIAKKRFTHTIHMPARGRRAIVPDPTPTTTNSVHIPSENTNKYINPSAALFVDATHVSTAAITGAEQGAATSPDSAPIANAPESRPPFPVFAAHSSVVLGTRIVTTSSMASAANSRTLAMIRYNHGLVLTDPKSVPVIPANSPRAE